MKDKIKNKKIEKREKKTLALTQIILLVVATIAVSWMIGSQVKIVSGADPCTSSLGCKPSGACQTSIGGTNCISGQVCCSQLKPGVLDCEVGNKICYNDDSWTCLQGNGYTYVGAPIEDCQNGCNPATGTCNQPQSNTNTCVGQGGQCVDPYSCKDVGLIAYNSECSPKICCKNFKDLVEEPPTEENSFDWQQGVTTGVGLIEGAKTATDTWKWMDNNWFGKGSNADASSLTGDGVGAAGGAAGGTGGTGTPIINAETGVIEGYSNPVVSKGSWLTGKGGTGTGYASSGGLTDLLQNIVSGVIWAAVTYLVITTIAKKYASERNAGDISTVSLIGGGLGVLLVAIIGAESTNPVGWIAMVVTIVAAGIYMLVGYQVYSREVFTFRVGMWQPPEGGADCNKCNGLRIAGDPQCSEYICHSYGLACEWINDETQYETCIEVNKGDRSPPIITPVKEIYGENVFPENELYNYQISSASTRILYTGEGGETGNCVPAFTPIKLALKTNENANCKISIQPMEGLNAEEKYNKMTDMMEGSSYTDNHTLELPAIVTASENSLEFGGYQLSNGGVYRFYIRCKDIRGNVNQIDYQMSFCVQTGPDTRPPKITGTSPAQNSFIVYGVNKITNFQVYTNEPADCKWDYQPKRYEFMSYNFDKCSQNINDKLRGFDFGCQGNLTGFKNGVENKYYIACLDQPELKGTDKEGDRNDMYPAEEIILKGTKQLLIQDVKINGKTNGSTIRGSTENINVKLDVTTFGGAEEGKARCKYSSSKTLPRAYSLFTNNNDRNHINPNTEDLYLSEENYTYFLQCFDIAGNIAETMINFSVQVDTDSPSIVRVYKEGNSLKLITNEEAECVYSNFGCIYDIDMDGIVFGSIDGINHLADWNIENDFYVKCKDAYGNPPAPDVCTLIARPFEILQAQGNE